MMTPTLTYSIVEDSLKVCEGIKDRMDDFPQWKCCCFLHHKTEAIKEIKAHQPQLIFIDWALKGGSAYEVLEEIVSIPDYTPYIIFNTGYQSENPEIPQQIINNYKIDKYLVKPLWENLRLHLATYLKEAELKCSLPSEKQNEVWLMDVERKKHKIYINSIVCVLQDFENPYYKIFILDNDQAITVRISWNSIGKLLEGNGIDFFVTNNREHIIVKNFVKGYKRPFVQVAHLKQRVEVVKNQLCAFEKWLVA